METHLDPFTSHQVITVSDPDAGLRAVIALDDLTLGPGFGGVRMRPYPTPAAAIEEAQRLARAMTFKHALAELPYGGAKSVIVADGRGLEGDARRRLFEAFGDAVARTNGRYIPGVDMATTLADMSVVRERGATVYCADADPSPWTARGVYAAMRAAVRGVLDSPDLSGVRVAVQGVGAVGGELARLVAADGGELVLADVDANRAETLAAELGGRAVPTSEIATTECDVFAPAAIARVVTADVVPQLRCRLVAGAANDTLDGPDIDAALLARGITFVPDYVANAGGVIHEHARAMGWTDERLAEAVDAIGDRVLDLVAEAGPGGSLVDAAERRGRARLAAGAGA
ncbi:Glu/Leu/Phe/Val dehydrogenase dimerization domain-containing protein [Mobilicoccus pelagius]|uniref:Leucine dehydrogenase n=1 Tax=Mobilicoccus pelagius NBRC 104925 TaxID=1089455 RepID=H5USZ7_9MICO|nr:Glu/Leu/Phe/Val dehydrogenase dimerization domain-containing protein [Mobilicoccus pelagius]GAB48855.1 leucine dehydrogenase [Mobilicoccus pelagius NBRC 104925]